MTDARISSPHLGLGPDLRGRRLGERYELAEPLGFGGVATVYAADDRHLRRPVAVKVVHPWHARTDDQRRRFRQEARVGAQVDHPNVARILDFGEVDGPAGPLLFLVMPRLSGRTLRAALLDAPCPWPVAVHWSRQLLAGLAAIHERGVVHRDLKPDNLQLVHDVDGERLVILDLGLAKLTCPQGPLDSERPRSTTGRLVGTLPYLAPEQARGEAVDHRADLYAAGVVLFELLTRRPPFVGSDYDVLVGHVERAPTPPSRLAPAASIPSAVDDVALIALAKRPADRFTSAVAFDAALERVLAEHGQGSLADLRAQGAGDAQAALAAWTAFEPLRALQLADRAAEQNRAWSPLRLLMGLVAEE